VTTVPRPKSPQSFAAVGLNQSGKIGIRRFVERENFAEW
jgi:hypothetical protein